MMEEQNMEDRILKIVLANIQNNNKSINIRFDAMRDSFGYQTKMIEGTTGLLREEIVDFRYDMQSKLGYINSDLNKIRNEIKKNHEEIIDLIERKFKLD